MKWWFYLDTFDIFKWQDKMRWKFLIDFLIDICFQLSFAGTITKLITRGNSWIFTNSPYIWFLKFKVCIHYRNDHVRKNPRILSHFIFLINVGKKRIRHTMTLLCRIRLFPTVISKIKWLGSELPLKTKVLKFLGIQLNHSLWFMV